MKARSGQVALYLVLTLVALTFLILMNVGAFLGVSARNATMNGGDAAALAVARHQGELLNRIGRLNIEHLKAAVANDAVRCEEIMREQMRVCLLDPLEGLRIGNAAARENGCDQTDEMREILTQHVRDIRLSYLTTPELYPEAWPGAWEEYAQRLELALGEGIWAGPDNIDFVDSATGHLLLDERFYDAIAGRNWCWFLFNAPGLLSSYSSFKDWGPLPFADLETRQRKCVNSEIYSLELDRRVGRIRDLLGEDLIRRLTGASDADLQASTLVNDPTQAWYFYDTLGLWRTWWELDPTGEWRFPAMGRVRSEYDVRGAAAVCRVARGFVNVVQEGANREAIWSGAAKAFGTVENEDGERVVVTALKGFVVPAFGDVRLVPLDGVGGRDLSTANPEWMRHVRQHLTPYLENGPDAINGCWYCRQLVTWERDLFRTEGATWLKYHGTECERPTGAGGGSGGSRHGH